MLLFVDFFWLVSDLFELCFDCYVTSCWSFSSCFLVVTCFVTFVCCLFDVL